MSPEQISNLTKTHLLKLLKELRKEKSEAPIMVGGQIVSTLRREDGEWLARKLHAIDAPEGTQYPYTPDNSSPTVLTRAQVLRINDCRTWYVNECFKIEAIYAAKIAAGMKFTQMIVALEADPNPGNRWPQTEFAAVAS